MLKNKKEIERIKMANIRDIAKAANVSATTVSNVLNGKSNVSEKTRENILKICREVNYYPNVMAQNLKAGKTNTVMFMFSDFDRSFYLQIIKGINDCLSEYGMGMIVCTHSTAQSFLQNGFVDGAIVLDNNIQDHQILSAAKEDMKIVVTERLIESPHVSCILTDSYSGMVTLTEGMIERGYKHFCYVGGYENTWDHKQRYDAFRQTLKEHNILFEDNCYYSGNYTYKSGLRAGKLIVMGDNIPEAIVCANDEMAAGVVISLREMGISVPHQVAVTGFDGEKVWELPDKYLTTVVLPCYEKGYIAAETVVKMIRGSESIIKKIKVPVRWGQSTI